MMQLPTWIVTYSRKPRLGAPLTSKDYQQVEVSASDRDGAYAAFNQRFPPHLVVRSIHTGSGTGMS
jgi:hypothetical protein